MGSLRSWLAPALAFTLAACASFVGGVASRRDHIRIPHARHAKADVDCISCHETVYDATDLSKVDAPKQKTCTGCHKEEQDRCGFCHTNPDAPQTYAWRDRGMKFDHVKHLERTQEDCKVCHQELPEPYATEALAPKMETCFGCHEHQQQWADGACDACHVDLARYGLRPLSAFSHRADFVKHHRLEARAAPAACAQCHEQRFCTDCHASTSVQKADLTWPERVDRGFIHRNDFLSRHMVEARADEALCQRCHGQSFCQDCHAKQGLLPGDGRGVNPHPAAYAEGSAHGRDARRNVSSCAACHDQGAASNCVTCHRVGGVGGNPHPVGWTLRHGQEEVGRNAMCQVCHR